MATSAGTISAPGMQATHDTEAIDKHLVNDAGFIRDLERLKQLRSFLLHEAVKVEHLWSADLNLLKFSFNGRSPTREEFDALTTQEEMLTDLLTEPLRRKFLAQDS